MGHPLDSVRRKEISPGWGYAEQVSRIGPNPASAAGRATPQQPLGGICVVWAGLATCAGVTQHGFKRRNQSLLQMFSRGGSVLRAQLDKRQVPGILKVGC